MNLKISYTLWFLTIGLAVFLLSCGTSEYVIVKGLNGSDGISAESCSVSKELDSSVINCPDGTSVVVNDGKNGLDGLNGDKGDKGDKGDVGANGLNGSSCSVSSAVNGAIISCTDGSSVVILNGSDASVTPYSVVDIIDPCGKQTLFDEILLKLHNGQIIASFSENNNGKNTRLSIIGPGNYVTTDGTNCFFKVHNDLSVTW